MEISNMFKDALSYSFSDYKKFLLVGVIIIIAQLSVIVTSYGVTDIFITGILGIVTIIFGLVISGYELSVIKSTIEGSDIIPDFDWIKNIVMGLKNIVVSFVYFIIPTIIVFIIAWVGGLFNSAYHTLNVVSQDPALNATLNQTGFSAVTTAAVGSFLEQLSIFIIIAVIIFIIFALFNVIANCRLADTSSIKEALNFKEVYYDITEIGWGKFISWAVIYAIIYLLIGCVGVALVCIPYVGIILAYLIVSSFLLLFSGRAFGLIYANE